MKDPVLWGVIAMLAACGSGSLSEEDTEEAAVPTNTEEDTEEAAAPTNTEEALGASSSWLFRGPGLELDVVLTGGPTWDFGLEGILFFGLVEFYPSTTCTLTGQDFLCEQVDFYDKLIDLSGTFDSTFETGTVTASIDGPDTGFGDIGSTALEGERQ